MRWMTCRAIVPGGDFARHLRGRYLNSVSEGLVPLNSSKSRFYLLTIMTRSDFH